MGDLPVLPTTGNVDGNATDSFSHSNETVSVGSYAVKLNNGVNTELTTMARSGMARFTFPSTTHDPAHHGSGWPDYPYAPPHAPSARSAQEPPATATAAAASTSQHPVCGRTKEEDDRTKIMKPPTQPKRTDTRPVTNKPSGSDGGAKPPGPGTSGSGSVGAVTGNGGKCIDENGASTTNGTKIQIWSCNGGTAQQLTVASDGSLQVLGKCLDIPNGILIDLWDCNGASNQQWNLP